MPNKLSKEKQLALSQLMIQGKTACLKLQADKEKLTEGETKELLDCVVKGERAREELIVALIGLVYKIAADLCEKHRCWDWHDQMISEGNFKLIKAVDGFKPEEGCLVSTYAYRKIFWGLGDLLKKERFNPPHNESLDSPPNGGDDKPRKELADPASNPERDLICRERSELLLSKIRELPEDDRKAILLRTEGLREQEIAEHFGVSLGAVKSRLHRARAKLRTQLGPLLATPTKSLIGGEEHV